MDNTSDANYFLSVESRDCIIAFCVCIDIYRLEEIGMPFVPMEMISACKSRKMVSTSKCSSLMRSFYEYLFLETGCIFTKYESTVTVFENKRVSDNICDSAFELLLTFEVLKYRNYCRYVHETEKVCI